MASLRDLKRQIQSVDNTAKVTNALQTVSGVKLRKAEQRVRYARPYSENIEEMMRDIAEKSSSNNPLLAGRDQVRAVAVVTLTSDRGLCGAFNAQVIRQTLEFRREQEMDVVQVMCGRKGVEVFRFRNITLEETYTGFSDAPSYEKAQEIGRRVTGLFKEETADEVYLIYNRYESPLVQRPQTVRLLPAAPDDAEQEDGQQSWDSQENPFEYIPGTDEILNSLIPRYVETLIFQALLESAAGEHGARMTAMKAATDNANELSQNLTLQMNKARQAQITSEIIEIAAAADALATG